MGISVDSVNYVITHPGYLHYGRDAWGYPRKKNGCVGKTLITYGFDNVFIENASFAICALSIGCSLEVLGSWLERLSSDVEERDVEHADLAN